jgi:hypothetical protein
LAIGGVPGERRDPQGLRTAKCLAQPLGLGDVVIRYGYQRFDTQVMAIVIVILVSLVCLIQFAGDFLVRRLRER